MSNRNSRNSNEPKRVSFNEALVICRKHSTSAIEMIDALGNRETYSVKSLRNWLGY